MVRVRPSGRRTGVAEKLEAHRRGYLHRAFSVFISDSKGRVLIQKRAASKYHFAGLWSNACCGHQKPGERTLSAARRRLNLEVGLSAPLVVRGSVTYAFVDDKSRLLEREFDYVLTGRCDGECRLDADEVAGVRWLEPERLLAEIEEHPGRFTPWFRLILEKMPQLVSGPR